MTIFLTVNHVLRFIEALALAGLLIVMARPIRSFPPLGSLLDPANGVWAVVRRAELPAQARASIPGLHGPVEVVYDRRGVPHIFAATTGDAYRALGYVVTRDRLFQMELQTRATAGRLSELIGPAGLDLDRDQRALTLAASADRAYDSLPPDSPVSRTLVAYAEGVNAWISGMSRADLPLEYRLLDATPMAWEPRFSYYLMRRMGYTLTYQADELRRADIVALVGAPAADALFPVNSPIQEPIQPGPGTYPRFAWRKLPPPGKRVASSGPGGELVAPVRREDRVSGSGRGSNSWVVSPGRSASGHALLAGDPHLDLTLPSIWYEAHLVVRDSTAAGPPLDVYGVTIPGAPGVVVGFNRDVAWTFTNTEADVVDYYAETLDDPANPASYRLDGDWSPLGKRVEVFRGKAGEVLATDTIYSTHRGPVLTPHGRAISMRWTVLESSGELAALLDAQSATSAADWLERTRGFAAPAQNMTVADRRGSIALRSTGRYPLRPEGAAGWSVQDGSLRRNDWTGYLPLERYPQGMDPDRGFLSSANQQPVDPGLRPGYLGQDWPTPWRAVRINQMLRANASVTLEAMRLMQVDVGSARADFFVPYFLRAASAESRAVAILGAWNRRYSRDDRRAVLFELAMDRLSALTWDELEGSTGRRIATPGDAILAELLQDPKNRWWDRAATGTVETRDEVLRLALTEALAQAEQRHGPAEGEAWRWDRVHRANVPHLLRLPALSALDLPPPGARGTMSPSAGNGSNGSSWRMVVDLANPVRAFGIYPGGQSGNPVSSRYRDNLDLWVAGQLDTLYVPRTPSELGPRLMSRLDLDPASAP